ncbi:MAG: GC-type dockerin domain-anchored protein [Phycisphaerales bacterium]
MSTSSGLVALAISFTSLPFMSAAQPPANPEWTLINPANTGVPGWEIEFIELGPDGRLWMGGRWPFWNDLGVAAYDIQNDLWENHSNAFNGPIQPVMFPDFPQDIDFAPDGSVWVAMRGGLARLHHGEWTNYNTSNAPVGTNWITDVEIDSAGVVWAVSNEFNTGISRVVRFDGAGWQWWSVGSGLPASWAPPWNQIAGLTIDANDTPWISSGTYAGLAKFENGAWTAVPGGSTMTNLVIDQAGRIWGHNSFEVLRYDAGAWKSFNAQNTPINSTSITGAHVGLDGRMYLTMWTGRVLRQTAPGADSFEIAYELGLAFNIGSFDVVAMPDGEMWITHYGTAQHDGFIRRVSATGQFIRELNTYNTGMPDYFPRRLTRDRTGNLWMTGEDGGLSRFDGTRWRNWGAHNGGSEPYPFAGNETMGGFYLDSSGTGWMLGNGVARWDPATGQFNGFWDWQNTPIFGGQLFTHAVEDMHGTIFASGDYTSVYRFDGSTWTQEPIQYQFNPWFAGLHTDSAGRVYLPRQWDIMRWDGAAWSTLPLPHQDYLAELDGVLSFAIAPDDSIWIGTGKGLVHAVNGQFTLYDESNSPMPARTVASVTVRDDGLVAASCHTLLSTTPFPSGVAVIHGDAGQAANWTVYGYGTHPIYHYQLSAVQFDRNGDLWICTSSEGVSIARIGEACYADCNADGQLTVADFGCFQTTFVAGDPYADCNADGVLTVADFGCFQTGFVSGCP